MPISSVDVLDRAPRFESLSSFSELSIMTWTASFDPITRGARRFVYSKVRSSAKISALSTEGDFNLLPLASGFTTSGSELASRSC